MSKKINYSKSKIQFDIIKLAILNINVLCNAYIEFEIITRLYFVNYSAIKCKMELVFLLFLN